MTRTVFYIFTLQAFCASLSFLHAQTSVPNQTEMLDAALTSEAGAFEEIVFAQRVSGRDHWYGNFGHYCENDSPYCSRAWFKEDDVLYAFAPGGRLCRYNLRTGKLKVSAG